MNISTLTSKILLLTSFSIFGHEGHGIPGALPPAPHGGNVAESTHVSSGHDHEPKEEVELFFEATYKNKILKIYPLTIDKNNTAIFAPISPKKDITDIELKIEIPKTKKTEKLSTAIDDDSISATAEIKNTNRFIIHLSVKHLKEKKTAKIQLELN